MTNLTEQYRNGKLSDGYYYVKIGTDFVVIDCYADTWDYLVDEQIEEISEPVPTYDEWQTAKKMIAQSIGVCDENSKLKELLKRVDEHFKWVDGDDGFYVNDELWEDIKKVLGEE